jgi:deoxycytidylate deaminase
MNRHEKVLKSLFQIARDIPSEAVPHRTRHAAAIMIKNNLISYGINEMKTHPFQAQYSKNEEAIFWHAETRAIHNALKIIDASELKKATLYVARVKIEELANKKIEIIGSSMPCCGCMKAIRDFSIKETVYTEDSEYYNELKYTIISRSSDEL